MNKSRNFLHIHSMYSIGDSTATPDAIVKRAKELGCENITLTDHGMLLGIEPFMDAGKKYEVNTIPGVEAYLTDRTHFILIARNYEGYQSICYAMRDANTQIENVGALTYPIMSDDILEKYFKDNPNIIATTACVAGPIGKIMTSSRRVQRKLEKTKNEMKMLVPQCELYLKVKEKLDETTEIIKNIKKERTANNKFNNKTFLASIDKLNNKLSLMDVEDKNYQKTANQLLEKTEQNNLAKRKLAEIDKKLKTLEPEKKQLKEQADQLKKTYTKYLKLKEKVDSTPEIPAVILYKKALDRMIYLKSIFKNLFIELQYHGIEDEAFNAEYLIKIANELKLPLIAANDAHMVDNSEESIEARRLVRFNYFKKSQTVDESDKELYLKTDDELRSSLLKIYNEEIVNKAMSNLNVLSYCKVEFPDEKHYPKVSSDVNFDNLLEKRRQEMISNGEWNDDYQKRLDHEVKIIKQMGYVDYHLVVRDFCIEGRKLGVIPKSERANMPEDFNEVEKWIKTKGYKEGVGIGPGRGSAAGSLVCYLLGITNIDPIKYDLLFERYLNPSRVSMPDIDTDVATSLRPFIIKYLKWKYGHRAVCSIATETTYAARAAVQMAGRERASQLYDHEPKSTATLHKSEYNRVHVYPLSDAVPDTPKIKLNDCIDDLKAKFGHDKEAMLVLNHALLLEGVVSGTGVHAGGVVISDNDNINEYLPLAWNEEKQVWTAQCDMVKVEERGLLKMDLLGLNTLDCINDCLYLIKKTKGISIDINKIPFEPEVFKKIYASGLTNSVFQFESQGMKSMLRDFKPTCFEDLILLVACYRPGPMQYLTDEGNSVNVIKVKNGQDPLRYLTPELEPILKSTYGGMIYQEQVMQVVQSLAGYSLGDADNIRRYMSKKKKDKLAHERQAFIYGDESRNIDGCVKRGISEDIANQLFDEMTDFASYAFNKSHAAAYAFVSYQTAWLKYHYPVEFECAMFNNKKQADFEPIIEDCKFLKIKLLQPDVNKSDAEFTTEGNCIRWGYYGIKGIGTANIDIIENIKTYGPYVSFKDFLVKNIVKNEKKTTILPKKITETFINAGAFDSLNSNRKDLYDFVEDNKLDITSSDNSEQLLKDIIESIPLETNPEDTQYNVENETELLGFVLSLDPLKGYRNEHKYQCIPISNVVPGQSDIMGYVTNIKDVCLKSGKAASVITIQGRDTSIEVWAYDNVMDKAKASLHNYKVFKFTIYKNEKGFITLRNFRSLNKGINEYNITIQTPEEYILFEDILKDSKYQQDYEISVSCKLRKTASGFQEHMSYGNVFVSGKALNILDSKIGLKKWSSKSV